MNKKQLFARVIDSKCLMLECSFQIMEIKATRLMIVWKKRSSCISSWALFTISERLNLEIPLDEYFWREELN